MGQARASVRAIDAPSRSPLSVFHFAGSAHIPTAAAAMSAAASSSGTDAATLSASPTVRAGAVVHKLKEKTDSALSALTMSASGI